MYWVSILANLHNVKGKKFECIEWYAIEYMPIPRFRDFYSLNNNLCGAHTFEKKEMIFFKKKKIAHRFGTTKFEI